VASFLKEKIEAGIFPGARYLVARGAQIRDEGWIGRSVIKPRDLPVGPDTIYDLASLTKPLVTGALAALLAARGVLDLKAPVDRYLPELSGGWLGKASVMDLLVHRSGLAAWLPVYLKAGDRDGYLREISALSPDYRPGSRVVYSCLGYILLTLVLERAGGEGLHSLAEGQIFSRVGLAQTGYRPAADLLPRIAATEEGNEREREMAGEAGVGFPGWRRGVIWGECHDLNAWTLGGVCGNAGVFSTALDLHRLALEFLGEGIGLFDSFSRSLFEHDLTPGLNENRSVGWQLATTPGASAGPLLSPSSMGHTGFTGTSLWIDPEEGWVLMLLTNRVHPRYRADDMNAIRREFHRRALAGARSSLGS